MKLNFRTNINCLGCIQTVTPFLESEPKILNWEVDIIHPDKILTVETDSMTEDEIIETIQESGFMARFIGFSV